MTIPRSRFLLFIPALIAGLALLVLFVRALSPSPIVISGVVDVTTIDIAPKIPGRVDSLLVREGDTVVRGQVLAVLESKEMDAKVGQARSAMEAARSRMVMAQRGARKEEKSAVERVYRQAAAQYELASKTWTRIERIYKDSLISMQEHDQAEFQYTAAREQMEAAKARYEMVLEGARAEEIDGATALFHQAENAYREALAYQQELRIVSPVDGEVSKLIVDAGEVISPGYPVVTVIKPQDHWVILQLREDQLHGIRVGQSARGSVRALDETPYDFRVTSVSAMADFATWKPTNQKGDFDLKTFEVRLRSNAPITGLRAGMTVAVTL